ncbi:unnamed protein product, partial [Oikopleura dioica]
RYEDFGEKSGGSMMIRAELGIYLFIITCYALYEFSGLIAFSGLR